MTNCCIHRSSCRRPPPIPLAAVLTGLTASISEMAGPARAGAESELAAIASNIRALAVRINTPRKTTHK